MRLVYSGRTIALVIVVGIILVAPYPITLASNARDYADVQRGMTAFVTVPLSELQPTPRPFELTIPDDEQWRRIGRRRGRPTVLIVAVSPREQPSAHTYSLRELGLSVVVMRNGGNVDARNSSDTPYGYSAFGTDHGLKFDADSGDRIRLSVRATAPIRESGDLQVRPNWGSLEMWDWVDGNAMAMGFSELATSALAAVGGVLIAAGAVLTWIRRRA